MLQSTFHSEGSHREGTAILTLQAKHCQLTTSSRGRGLVLTETRPEDEF